MVSAMFHLSPSSGALISSPYLILTHTHSRRRLQILGDCRVQEYQGENKSVRQTNVNENSLGWEKRAVETTKHLEQSGVNQIDFCRGCSE